MSKRAVLKGLDRAYDRTDSGDLNLDDARLVVFSDHHRGRRDLADDFAPAEAAYHGALGYYLAAGYTLVLLGDVEELWECRPADVLAAYARTIDLEGRFHRDGRLVRVYGNHDDEWESPRAVRRHLDPLIPGIKVLEGVRLRVSDGGDSIGEIVLLHGHQGTVASDRTRWISKLFVRWLWRPLQRFTGARLNTPSTSYTLRGRHAEAMSAWVRARSRLILIAGHTHMPVFYPEPRSDALASRRETMPDDTPVEALAELSADIEWLRVLEGGGSETGRPDARYFNTGCCSFDDGDCTGIEIADGEIRLVRWPDDDGKPRRKILRRADLRSVFRD